MSESNMGQTGLESIRLGGMKIDSLPIAESALTKEQMPVIQESIKRNELGNIIAKYPKQTVDWVKGAIRECEDTIKKVRALKGQQQTMIDEYTGHISLCSYRDKEIAKTDDKGKIADLKLQFPPYNVEAMQQQITQCKEAIERSDGVIDKEHNAIADLKKLLTTCQQRDKELEPFGIKGQ